MAQQISVRLVKSTIGCSQKQKACIKGLGLRKLNSVAILQDTPEVRGMINKVSFLLQVSDG